MSAPTEPTHPPVAEPTLERVPGASTDATLVAGAGEPDSAAAGVPSRRGGRGRSRRQHGGERPPKKKKVETPPEAPKDPVLERAKLVSEEAAANMNDILYNPAIERKAAEGDGMEEIPEEEQSYKAKRIAYTESKLDFSYDVEPPSADEYRKAKDHKKGKGKRKSEHRPHIKIEQAADDHSIARRNIIYLTTDVFTADMARVDAEITAATAKADSDGKGADVLKVVRDKTEKDSPSLEAWLNGRKVQLEWLRVDVIRDAADWFDVRVDQVETMMHEITKRTDKPSSVDKRLEALTTHAEFLEQEENLREDIKMFESFLELPLTPGAEATRQVVKGIVDHAKKKLTRYEAQKKSLLDLKVKKKWVPKEGGEPGEGELVVDEEHGKDPVENARDGFMRDLLNRPIAEKFVVEAEKRMVGLSPEEELNFWKSLDELLQEVEARVPKGLKGVEARHAREQRLDRLNSILGLFENRGGNHYLVKIDDRTNPKEALPYGFGQIVERCRAEAKLIGELKNELFFLMIKMGYETRRATQTALRGHSNTEKIEATQRFNQLADKTRRQAFAQLQEIKKETPDMDDAAKAALAEANTAAVAFKTELAGRDVKDLRWNRKEEGQKEADRPLLIKLRQKMLELINLGTLSDIDIAELQDILFPEPVVESGKVETGEEVTTPLFERIKSGDLPTEWFTKAGVTAEQLKDMVVDLDGRLGKALQSGVVYETMVKQFTMLQPKELNVTTVQQFADTLEFIVKTCEQMKEAIGQDWCKQFGLRQVDERTGKRGVANSDYIVRMLGEMETGVGSTEALLRAGGDTVLKAMLVKVGAGEVVIPDDRKDDVRRHLMQAMVDYNFRGVTKDVVQTWLTEATEDAGDGEPAREVEAPQAVLELMAKALAGTLDATQVAKVFPHMDGKPDVTPEYIQTSLQEDLGAIEQTSGSAALRAAVEQSFHLVVPEGSSAEEVIQALPLKMDKLADAFRGMRQVFGEQWAADCGLLTEAGEVNETVLLNGLAAFDTNDDAIDAFMFDANATAQERLLNMVDSGITERFTKMEISVADQVFVLMLCVPRTPDDQRPNPNQALTRLATLLEFGNLNKRTGEYRLKGVDLLKRLNLVEGDGDDLVYRAGTIIEAISNDSFD